MTESIGRRLKRLRLEQGFSQRELAAKGVSYAYISRIEAGTRRPSVKALRLLAENLGVSPEYLEFGREYTTTDELAAELAELTGGGLSVSYATIDAASTVTVAFPWGTETRAASGDTLTSALMHAIGWHRELERLRLERERIEAAERALAGPALAGAVR